MTQRTQPTPINRSSAAPTAQQTLIDHLHELRTRLFLIVLSLLIASSIGYMIQDKIMAALMRPLGGQRLVYLTPIGGFNFIFKVSLYVGIGLILPVIIYHLYRFLEPLMDQRRKRSVIFYSIASTFLALAGASFAYFGSLPAALHFLTGFNIQNVSAMLTVDSYLAFVITYVLGFAALFQIPLILMIINTIKPLPPKKLMGFQRFVILAAFILAAVLSPTPDITNQAILAVPIIIMYQIGVLLVWLQSRKIRRRNNRQTAPTATAATPPPTIKRVTSPLVSATQPVPRPATQHMRPRPVMDMTLPGRQTVVRSVARPLQVQRAATDLSRHTPVSRPLPSTRPQMARRQSPSSIDGIMPRSNQLSQAS